MAYEIIISQTGEESYFENLDFLFKYWSLKEVQNFIEKTESVKNVLKEHPYAFPIWEHDDQVRRVPIVEQITLLYSVYNNFVELLIFWNNYQDPKKLFDFLHV